MMINNNERAKAARNAYARKWRAKNRDKVKEAQERYWNRIAERMEGNDKPTAEEPKEATHNEQI